MFAALYRVVVGSVVLCRTMAAVPSRFLVTVDVVPLAFFIVRTHSVFRTSAHLIVIPWLTLPTEEALSDEDETQLV